MDKFLDDICVSVGHTPGNVRCDRCGSLDIHIYLGETEMKPGSYNITYYSQDKNGTLRYTSTTNVADLFREGKDPSKFSFLVRNSTARLERVKIMAGVNVMVNAYVRAMDSISLQLDV